MAVTPGSRLGHVTFVVLSIDSSPASADVAVKGYLAHDAPWISLENVRVPFGAVRVRLTKDGLTPVEAMRHIPVRIHDMIREILDWFDRHLGQIPAAG